MTRNMTFVVVGFLSTMGLVFLSGDRASAASSNDDIETVHEAGDDSSSVKDVIGSEAQAALRKLQEEGDLPATGNLDEETSEKPGATPDSPTEHFAGGAKDVGRGGKPSGKGTKAMGGEVKGGNVGEGADEVGRKAGQVARPAGFGVKDALASDGDMKPGSDEAIEQSVKEKLAKDPRLNGANVEVEDGVVTLSGQLDTAQLRDQALKAAQSVSGVKRVTDEIRVVPMM
jgi:BON domain